MYQRALARVSGLLESHVPEPLPDDVRRQIRDIVDAHDRKAAGA